MTEQELMLKAKSKVGISPQLLKLAEESNELGAAVLRFTNRAPWSRPESDLFLEMLEELIDVDLMIQQVKIYLNDETLQIIRKKKLARYESRVKSLENNHEDSINSSNSG